MTFTDDDLERLKDYSARIGTQSALFKALLHRLECAEAVMPDIEKFKIWSSTHPRKCTFSQTKSLVESWEAWRKAKGE